MGEHTAGEWTSNRVGIIRKKRGNNTIIALTVFQGTRFEEAVTETQANARLIAAAPELLWLVEQYRQEMNKTNAIPLTPSTITLDEDRIIALDEIAAKVLKKIEQGEEG